jgi:thioredoxin 1
MADIVPSKDFKELIRTETKPVLIDVFGAGCEPCVWMSPVIDALAEDLKDEARIVKLDRDEARANGGAHNPVVKFIADNKIQGIPAMLLFDKGEFKGALMGGPRAKSNVREWMEKKLGHAFNTAAAPKTVAKYGIVVDNLPEDMNKMFEVAGDLYNKVSTAVIGFYATDDVRGVGVGPIDAAKTLRGVSVDMTAAAAQALADALPGEKLIDGSGKRIEPAQKPKTPFFCVDDPAP